MKIFSSCRLFVSELAPQRALSCGSWLNNKHNLKNKIAANREQERLKKNAFVQFQRLCSRSTFDSVAVGIVLAALVHRIFIHHQANVIVTTLDRGVADWVSHPPALYPAGHAQMHPQLSRPEKNNCQVQLQLSKKEKKITVSVFLVTNCVSIYNLIIWSIKVLLIIIYDMSAFL